MAGIVFFFNLSYFRELSFCGPLDIFFTKKMLFDPSKKSTCGRDEQTFWYPFYVKLSFSVF